MESDPTYLVLDTNIVLDLFVFADARVGPLESGLAQGRLAWLATRSMRDELERVLGYAHIEERLAFYGVARDGVLAAFDRHARLVEAPGKAPLTCGDRDDQKFIDLAVAHRAMLLSKDKQVLTLKRKLAALDVTVDKTLQ